VTLEPHDVRFFESPEELRDWFDANHATAADLWLGSYRKASGRPSVSWSDAVDEALCVGWIDSIRKRLDDTRSAQRFTPRRKGSTWSAINVAKVAALTASGRMRPAGLAAFERRTEANTAVYSYERPEATFSDVELERFRAVPEAWTDWERRSPSYRRTVTHWVTSAKGVETRARRLEALIADSAAGQMAGPMRWSRQAT
jgi:uncharacterized protein YdeI (YjbR/CyaY-like superfamily)